MSERGGKNDIEEAAREHRMLQQMLAEQINSAAGTTTVRRVVRATGPDWPERKDYPNRAEFRRACAKWRKRP